MAWLGLAGMFYLYPCGPLGALEDQIKLSSQIRVRLTVECLKKTDGYGIEMGAGSLITEGPSGTSRDYCEC